MYYANTSNATHIYIDDSVNDEQYFCPVCGGLMIRKMGAVNQHHFAHKRAICDPWYSDNKGPWHRMMQNLFPKECQEVIMEEDGVKHIADIYLPSKDHLYDIVIEFQHSFISEEEWLERYDFYSRQGCEVIWVFDISEKDVRQIPYHYDVYRWYRPFSALSFAEFGHWSETPIYFYIKPQLRTSWDGSVITNGYQSPQEYFITDNFDDYPDLPQKIDPYSFENAYSIIYGEKIPTPRDFANHIIQYQQDCVMSHIKDKMEYEGEIWIKLKDYKAYQTIYSQLQSVIQQIEAKELDHYHYSGCNHISVVLYLEDSKTIKIIDTYIRSASKVLPSLQTLFGIDSVKLAYPILNTAA